MSNLVNSKAALIGFYEGSLKAHVYIIENIEQRVNDRDFMIEALRYLKNEVKSTIKEGEQYWKEIQG